MRRCKLFLVHALLLGFFTFAFAGGPPADPFDFTFTSFGPITDDGDGTYVNGADGVVANFPGTGSFIVDPDRDAKRNSTRRFIQIDFPGGIGPLTGTYHAFFMSINAVGKACDGTPFSTAPRDLDLDECIQTNVGLNDISEPDSTATPYVLRCGDSQSGSYPNPGDLDNASTTCVSAVNGTCTDWLIEPLGGPGGRLRCALFEFVKVKGGQYIPVRANSVPYDIHFTATVSRQ